jgi:hypothetical protein
VLEKPFGGFRHAVIAVIGTLLDAGTFQRAHHMQKVN